MHNAYRIDLKGVLQRKRKRKKQAPLAGPDNEPDGRSRREPAVPCAEAIPTTSIRTRYRTGAAWSGTLEAIAAGHPNIRLDELLPQNFDNPSS